MKKTYVFSEPDANLPAILLRPELAGQRILNIEMGYVYDDEDRPVRPRFDITVEPSPTGQQIIEPTVAERLEAAELMIDLLLDTQQESA
jgi:hypothetical protein